MADCGGLHSAVVTQEGSLFAWGDGRRGASQKTKLQVAFNKYTRALTFENCTYQGRLNDPGDRCWGVESVREARRPGSGWADALVRHPR